MNQATLVGEETSADSISTTGWSWVCYEPFPTLLLLGPVPCDRFRGIFGQRNIFIHHLPARTSNYGPAWARHNRHLMSSCPRGERLIFNCQCFSRVRFLRCSSRPRTAQSVSHHPCKSAFFRARVRSTPGLFSRRSGIFVVVM